jgi:hypothetical protein
MAQYLTVKSITDMSEYGVLHLPPVVSFRNAVTGRFMKGHVPANKGKKWDEFMSKRSQKRSSKGWRNLDLYRCKGGGGRAGRPKKAVVAITDDGRFRVFSYIKPAAEYVGGSRENVARCCRQNGCHHANTDHRYMGVRFYYESDSNWLNKIQK